MVAYTHHTNVFSLFADVQHPLAEHTAGPAADSERASDQHEGPAAREFTHLRWPQKLLLFYALFHSHKLKGAKTKCIL